MKQERFNALVLRKRVFSSETHRHIERCENKSVGLHLILRMAAEENILVVEAVIHRHPGKLMLRRIGEESPGTKGDAVAYPADVSHGITVGIIVGGKRPGRADVIVPEKIIGPLLRVDYKAVVMNQKDEITNQSYASILAHENELSEQRQIMHDQMMLNASSWSDYMQTVMMQTAQTMQDTLAEGITNWIMQAKSLSEVFSNLAKTILQQLIQGALKKWISSLGIIRTLNDAADKAEAASAAAQTSAIMTKAAAQARLAAATMISAMPFTAYGAGAIVAGQMDIASTGASVLKKAKGGAIIGPGTSTSDSIPALLSNGEYVINADAAAQIGRTTLDALNSGAYPAFASGGSVGGVDDGSGGRNLGNPVVINVSTMDADSFRGFIKAKGKRVIRQALYDDVRDFKTESGVW